MSGHLGWWEWAWFYSCECNEAFDWTWPKVTIDDPIRNVHVARSWPVGFRKIGPSPFLALRPSLAHEREIGELGRHRPEIGWRMLEKKENSPSRLDPSTPPSAFWLSQSRCSGISERGAVSCISYLIFPSAHKRETEIWPLLISNRSPLRSNPDLPSPSRYRANFSNWRFLIRIIWYFINRILFPFLEP